MPTVDTGVSAVGLRSLTAPAMRPSGARPRPTIHQPASPRNGSSTSTGSSRRHAVRAASSVRNAVGCATWISWRPVNSVNARHGRPSCTIVRVALVGARHRTRPDDARDVWPIECRVPDLHQHALVRIRGDTFESTQVEHRVIAQRQRDLPQFLVEQRVDFVARRKVRRRGRGQARDGKRGQQGREQPATDRGHVACPGECGRDRARPAHSVASV